MEFPACVKRTGAIAVEGYRVEGLDTQLHLEAA